MGETVYATAEPGQGTAGSSAEEMTEPKETPLPKLQLFILLYLQLAEPIASTVVYPFVNQLVRQTGITGGNDEKTGYFAGLIESSFYATEAVCILQWGRASDRIGRKPVLLGGLLGLTLSMIGFGLSKHYWALVLSRCAEGALNGNIGVTKSMMAEITDSTNRDRGFSYLPMIWCLGSTIGPVIGGVFAAPATRWPGTFRSSNFWITYPYFLPCIIAACISISAFSMALLGLKETLPPSKRQRKSIGQSQGSQQAVASSPLPHRDWKCDLASRDASGGNIDPPSTAFEVLAEPESRIVTMEVAEHPIDGGDRTVSDGHDKDKAIATFNVVDVEDGQLVAVTSIRSILIPRVLLPILNYGFLAFIDQSTVVLLPLMYSSPVSEGGLNMSSFTIGIIQGVAGVIGGVIQILTFAWMHRKFGTKRLYLTSFSCYLLCICAFPLLSLVTKRAGRVGVATWVLIVLQETAYSATLMTWGCIFMYISDGAPNQAALGLTNGLAQTTASTARALAPSAASSLFSVSLQQHLASGALVYWILCAITAGGIVASLWLPTKLLS
ncbi:major facilitator superfamily domain-containing protein [Sparassis latifolia]